MNELIRVDSTGDRPAVSARELHEFLEIETPYHKWFPRMCEYGFTENEDYSVTDIFVHNPAGGPQTMKDAAITIDMAKEICMIQRSEKGKIARQYFLALERDWNSPEKVMARALQIADRKIKALEDKTREDAPKVLFHDAVAASDGTILIRDLAKLLAQNGVPNMGGTRLFDWLRNNGYLCKEGKSRNLPTQRAIEMDLFRIRESVRILNGETFTDQTTRVTGKGQQYFIKKFLANRPETGGRA